MTWDYLLYRAGQLEEHASRLSNLKQRFDRARREGSKNEQNQIRQRIQKELESLKNILIHNCEKNPDLILAAGLVEDATIWCFRDWPFKEKVRQQIYMEEAAKHIATTDPGKIAQIDFCPNFMNLLSQTWLGLQVDFILLTPWYSKDDKVFHFLDNPVRKDRIFGKPLMSAASWKGLLRWACRMQAGLREHLEEGKRFEEWNDPDWILHLFGNEKGEEASFHKGALVFYSTWFDHIGFEVINPHSRERRAGTKPIYYEVVPPGARGTLYLLYAPWPGMQPTAEPEVWLPQLLEAIEALITTYGISAKRTVGWGTAMITKWKAFRKNQASVENEILDKLWNQIKDWF